MNFLLVALTIPVGIFMFFLKTRGESSSSKNLSSGSFSTHYNGSNLKDVQDSARSVTSEASMRAIEWRSTSKDKPFGDFANEIFNDVQGLLDRMATETDNSAYAKRNGTGKYTYYVNIVCELKPLYLYYYTPIIEEGLKQVNDPSLAIKWNAYENIYKQIDEYFMSI